MNTLLKIIVPAMLLFSGLTTNAQRLTAAERQAIEVREDSLKVLADSMINGQTAGRRFLSDSQFVKTFVRTLVRKNSFYYHFDSLSTVSVLYPADSTFRIFTWQLKKDDYMYYQKGAIQMRTPDGSLKLYSLFDASMFTGKPQDSIRKRNNWIGAIYYRIIQKSFNGRTFYTLLGFDDFSVSSNRKWLEVLSFDKTTGEPLFGETPVSFINDTTKKKTTLRRFYIEYKKEARTTFNYNPELDMIIYDHLISESEEPSRPQTFIPDGDFEGFKWQNGEWTHVDKVFDFKLQDGQFPVEQLLNDKDGNINEEKLRLQSEKNLENAKKKEEQKKPAPKKKTGGN